MYTFNLKEFKTQPCSGCAGLEGLNLACPYYHSDLDRRRPPSQGYSPLYLYSHPSLCLNLVEYLFHPSLYKSWPCSQVCRFRLKNPDHCPFSHGPTQSPPTQPQIVEQKKQESKIYCLSQSQKQLVVTPISVSEPIIHELSPPCAQQPTSAKNMYSLNQHLPFPVSDNYEMLQFKDYLAEKSIIEVAKTVVAMANGDGGMVLLGVSRKGTVKGMTSGAKLQDKLLLKLDHQFRKYVSPSIGNQFSVKFYCLDSKQDLRLCEIVVQKKALPHYRMYSYDKQVFVRRQAENKVLGPEQIMKLLQPAYCQLLTEELASKGIDKEQLTKVKQQLDLISQ